MRVLSRNGKVFARLKHHYKELQVIVFNQCRDFGTRGWRFKSSIPDQFFSCRSIDSLPKARVFFAHPNLSASKSPPHSSSREARSRFRRYPSMHKPFPMLVVLCLTATLALAQGPPPAARVCEIHTN